MFTRSCRFVSSRQRFFVVALMLLAVATTNCGAWLFLPTITITNNQWTRTSHGRNDMSLQVSSSRNNIPADGMPGSKIDDDDDDDHPHHKPLFSSSSSTDKKKKKTNKYAQFSKVENSNAKTQSLQEDPLEALIRESEEKLRQLQQEKEAAKNAKRKVKPVTPDADKRLNFPNNKDIDPYDPTTFGYVQIGTVLGAHGVHGWNKVQGCTDFPERLTTPGMVLHLKPYRKRAPRKLLLVDGKCTGPDSFLVQLQDVYDRVAAEKLKGGTLYYATQQDHVKQKEDLLLSDLVGLQVVLLKEEEGADQVSEYIVGTVGAVVLAEEMCAIPGLGQDMLEVIVEGRRQDGHVKAGVPKDLVLIPMVPEIVPKIDLELQRVWIDPPAGLLDLTYIREEKIRIKGLLPPAKG